MRIIDLHCDTILGIMTSQNHEAELRKNDLCVDIEKLRKGNYMAQFFAMFIDLANIKDPAEKCLDMIDRFYCELEKNKDDISFASNYSDLLSNRENGKMSAFLTIEEGGALKGKLENLRNFYRLGVRLITLTWNHPNEIGYPHIKEEFIGKGLTPFGEEVVHEMNRLGMIIDVSHLNDAGFYDVARLTSKPFVASHSNARGAKDHTRNLTDDMIKILAEKGGVTGINFCGAFLRDSEMSKVEDIVTHIKYIKNVGGIDVVAMGTDFDGIGPNLEIKNAGEMDKLTCALENAGFTGDEIDKIYYKNTLRVIEDIL